MYVYKVKREYYDVNLGIDYDGFDIPSELKIIDRIKREDFYNEFYPDQILCKINDNDIGEYELNGSIYVDWAKNE